MTELESLCDGCSMSSNCTLLNMKNKFDGAKNISCCCEKCLVKGICQKMCDGYRALMVEIKPYLIRHLEGERE